MKFQSFTPQIELGNMRRQISRLKLVVCNSPPKHLEALRAEDRTEAQRLEKKPATSHRTAGNIQLMASGCFFILVFYDLSPSSLEYMNLSTAVHGFVTAPAFRG